MKEVMSTAHNIALTVKDGSIIPVVEAIITVTEPQYRFDDGGGVVSFRVPETLRFHSMPEGIRTIAKDLQEWADEADEVAKKAAAGEMALYEEE